MMSTYSRVRARGLGNGWPYQPSTTCGPETPRPSTNRPSLRESSVMAAIAVAVGVRAESWMRLVPSLMLLVCDPHHASGLTASDPYASAVHTESYPRRSASRMVSTAPAGGPAPQYPTCKPSFMDVETTVPVS